MKLLPSLIVFIFSLLFISCQKEYSIKKDTDPNAAVFSLPGASANCTGFTLRGTYRHSLPMTAVNMAEMQIIVTKAGSYNITTDSINGIIFSATGNFTDIGAHTITFLAKGTPAAEGAKTFSLSGSGGSCTFIVTFVP